eukprot:TRINITY_DN4812_c0_g1_i1.p1 TRINITY_DN4812_c0_g1~~TRINITY_DN4812_c0_g1_i1.p1  ORF type:complete len:988 (-),score=172.49 TRINITY_DN4812_c0_g1_i1:850-3813(-)
MFETLFGDGQTSKCKSLIKSVNSRLDLLRNKRRTKAEVLTRDVAELLRKGRDDEAFLRVEWLCVEEKMLRVYDLIETYCQRVRKQLSSLHKNRTCPQDIKEAISNLIFAAASCAEIPELQALRGVFATRYGDEFAVAAVQVHADSGVNKEMVENLSAKEMCKAEKIKLLKEIANKIGLSWAYSFPQDAHQVKIMNAPKNERKQLRDASSTEQSLYANSFSKNPYLESNCERDAHEMDNYRAGKPSKVDKIKSLPTAKPDIPKISRSASDYNEECDHKTAIDILQEEVIFDQRSNKNLIKDKALNAPYHYNRPKSRDDKASANHFQNSLGQNLPIASKNRLDANTSLTQKDGLWKHHKMANDDGFCFPEEEDACVEYVNGHRVVLDSIGDGKTQTDFFAKEVSNHKSEKSRRRKKPFHLEEQGMQIRGLNSQVENESEGKAQFDLRSESAQHRQSERTSKSRHSFPEEAVTYTNNVLRTSDVYCEDDYHRKLQLCSHSEQRNSERRHRNKSKTHYHEIPDEEETYEAHNVATRKTSGNPNLASRTEYLDNGTFEKPRRASRSRKLHAPYGRDNHPSLDEAQDFPSEVHSEYLDNETFAGSQRTPSSRNFIWPYRRDNISGSDEAEGFPSEVRSMYLDNKTFETSRRTPRSTKLNGLHGTDNFPSSDEAQAFPYEAYLKDGLLPSDKDQCYVDCHGTPRPKHISDKHQAKKKSDKPKRYPNSGSEGFSECYQQSNEAEEKWNFFPVDDTEYGKEDNICSSFPSSQEGYSHNSSCKNYQAKDLQLAEMEFQDKNVVEHRWHTSSRNAGPLAEKELCVEVQRQKTSTYEGAEDLHGTGFLDSKPPKPKGKRGKHHVKSSRQSDFAEQKFGKAVPPPYHVYENESFGDVQTLTATPSSLNLVGSSPKQITVLPSKITDVEHEAPSKSPPGRSVSLPAESPPRPSLQPKLLKSQSDVGVSKASHVHPKLPDYDDLTARFAALKQQRKSNSAHD